MIEVFEGRLGGGKTYHAAKRIAAYLSGGGTVVSNLEIEWPAMLAYCRDVFAVEVHPEQLVTLPELRIREFYKVAPTGTRDCPTLVVIDELHLWFNSRDTMQKDGAAKATMSFLTQSRKLCVDVIFITQSADNVDVQWRRLVQYIWRFRDMSKYKLPGLGIPWPLNQFFSVQYDYDGKTQLQRFWELKDRRVYGIYKSEALFQGGFQMAGSVVRRSLSKVKWYKRRGAMKSIVFLVLAVLSLVGWGVNRLSSSRLAAGIAGAGGKGPGAGAVAAVAAPTAAAPYYGQGRIDWVEWGAGGSAVACGVLGQRWPVPGWTPLGVILKVGDRWARAVGSDGVSRDLVVGVAYPVLVDMGLVSDTGGDAYYASGGSVGDPARGGEYVPTNPPPPAVKDRKSPFRQIATSLP